MQAQKIALAVLSVAILGNFALLPMASAQEFSVISSGDYVDSVGQRHIVGEVQNDSDNVATLVQIEATMLDENGEVIDRPSGRIFIDVIQPGEKSAFHLVFFDTEQASNVSSYELHVTGEVAEDGKPRMLEASSSGGYVDDLNQHHVVGEVTNNGDVAATFVEVSAALYDGDGNVIDAISSPTVPQSILPGGTAMFDMISLAPDAAATSMVSINAQSVEYANIPEFSIAILGTVGAVMGMIILLGRRWPARFPLARG